MLLFFSHVYCGTFSLKQKPEKRSLTQELPAKCRTVRTKPGLCELPDKNGADSQRVRVFEFQHSAGIMSFDHEGSAAMIKNNKDYSLIDIDFDPHIRGRIGRAGMDIITDLILCSAAVVVRADIIGSFQDLQTAEPTGTAAAGGMDL